MQLLSIGLFELHGDGSQELDDAGEPIVTYDTDHIQACHGLPSGHASSTSAPPPPPRSAGVCQVLDGL